MPNITEVAVGILGAGTALLGHASIVVWLFNRLHAQPWRRKILKSLEKVMLLAAVVVGPLLAIQLLPTAIPFDSIFVQVYAVVCWLALAAAIPLWLVPKLLERTPAALVSNDTTTVHVYERLGSHPLCGARANLMFRVPGNEILRLGIHKKTLHIPRLPAALRGLTIVHLSDLHMTGQLSQEFYDVVVDEANSLEPDLIAITGDILEKTKCLPWVAPTLGRLRAREGKYFVLGNHEQRLPDVIALRNALANAGLVDLGSRCLTASIRGAEVLLAGTELPWFGEAPIIPAAREADESSELPFRILLSHSPDQFRWARTHSMDLMLAGHTHGGQIRLPYFGALVAPSCYGFRYAGGVYHEGPTVLHVTRGIAGIHPIRLNCPPEIALLILKPA